ncbi:MAG TPA: polyphosphate glucokinase [Candidatus Atribacteria bacterium]|nr:polyphosphate glucokinase [Candidatus Atribacteria bacterium]
MIVLGIDFGGTGIKSALVDCATGQLVSERVRVHTPHKAKPDDVGRLIHQLVLQHNWTGRVGIGFPAVICDGVALNAANISKKWIGMDVAQFIAAQTGCSARVINDADAAGLAEMTFGAGREYADQVVLLLTVGTGIGTAVFTHGQLLPNTEFGHLQVKGADAEKRVSDYVRRAKNLSWKKWSRRFQGFLDEMEKLLNPDVIIIGGGGSKYFDEFSGFLNTRASLRFAQFQNTAGIIGAALHAGASLK